MKVEIDSAALADAVAWTTRVIDARPANPILAGIRLEAIDGTLQLSAFNYEISARHHIEAGIDEPGTALVLGKLLADITKSLPAEKTYLSTDASTLTISSGKSTFTLQLMPDTEYPDLPIVPAKIGQVDAPTCVQAVSQASVAVSREENRPVLTGVRIQFEGDKVVMTSTDRFRLSRSSFSWTPQDRDLSTTTLVRGSLLRDVARSLDEHQNVVLDLDTDTPSLLRDMNPDDITSLDISIAAGKGDQMAKDIFEFTGRMLGQACADFATFCSPEAFVFFGGLVKAGELIMDPIRRSYDESVMPIFRGKAKFLVSGLDGASAAVLGASALGWDLE